MLRTHPGRQQPRLSTQSSPWPECNGGRTPEVLSSQGEPPILAAPSAYFLFTSECNKVVRWRPLLGRSPTRRQYSLRCELGWSDPAGSASRLMMLEPAGSVVPQSTRNLQHPGVGTSTMLGPPATLTTGSVLPKGVPST